MSLIKPNKNIFNTLSDKKNEKATELHKNLRRKGIDFATGVPCGVLRHIIINLANDSNILHVPANRESEAVGIAAGAYFSGKRVVVYMQNSGLFAASNDIASLLIPYQIPIFFVVSYRGCAGETAIQHKVTGKATKEFIKSFGLHYVLYENQNINILIDKIFEKMEKDILPVILLIKRGWNYEKKRSY